MTKIVEIELKGVPGSGKTLIGDKIIDMLKKQKYKCEWFDEENHTIKVIVKK